MQCNLSQVSHFSRTYPIWPYCERSTFLSYSSQFSPPKSIKLIHKKRIGRSRICMFPSPTPQNDSVQEVLKAYFKNTALGSVWLFLLAEDTPHISLEVLRPPLTQLPLMMVQVVQHAVKHILQSMTILCASDRVFFTPNKTGSASIFLELALLPSLR